MGVDVIEDGDPIERFGLSSLRPMDQRIDLLREHFPEAFGELGLDLAQLGSSLGEWVMPESERFGIQWPGRAECAQLIQEPSVGTLVPVPELSVGWDKTENVIVEGENLEVLKLLQRAYHGKVKLIFIDPPYNTGNEFVYPDKFKEGLADYLRYSGQADSDGLRLSANSETSGRYHSNWLSMMYPRLFLARNLLRDDGAIFVSIDDNEVHHLRMVLNEIFGEENFLASVVWKHTNQSKNDERYFSRQFNYLLGYRKSDALPRFRFARSEADNVNYSNPDDDPRGEWRSGDVRSPNPRPSLRYDIETPSGNVITPPENGWRWKRETVEEKMATGEIVFSSDESRIIRKIYLADQDGRTPENLWDGDFAGTSRSANAELKLLFDDPPFDTPKPTQLIRRILELVTPEGGLVLDFFAGSGSTGHAVVAANAAGEPERHFMMVQLPEPTGRDDFNTISDITVERVKRAGELLRQDDGENIGDTGFRLYRLAGSNFRQWDASSGEVTLFDDSLKGGSASAAIVSELLLKAGFELTETVRSLQVVGGVAWSVADGELLVVADIPLTLEAFEALLATEPMLILVLDRCFGDDDELKVNAMQAVRAANQGAGTNITLKVV